MPSITFLPHPVLCPEGKTFHVNSGVTLLEAALQNGVEIDHACGGEAACTTCHVIIREGFDSLEQADDREEDMLDKAWSVEMSSRLSCQTIIKDADLVVEIPKYSVNYVREAH